MLTWHPQRPQHLQFRRRFLLFNILHRHSPQVLQRADCRREIQAILRLPTLFCPSSTSPMLRQRPGSLRGSIRRRTRRAPGGEIDQFGKDGIDFPKLCPSRRHGQQAEWDDQSPEARKESSRMFECYAGMITCMDREIGRVVQHLEQNGELDNTVIMFMSDNGSEGSELGELSPPS